MKKYKVSFSIKETLTSTPSGGYSVIIEARSSQEALKLAEMQYPKGIWFRVTEHS